ncbi:MAG: cobalamin biosynthesis protein, partial [Dehalococcoidia bacterium]|nr:cobalamin biosynthesis protein [Dehalococcoidia bacterium]
RLLAPLLNSKYYDPAVITVDEAGKYSVSLLSGHIGGANKLAEEVASIIQAQPIITSASDILNTLTVDTLGREHGWIIENPSALKAVSSAIVNELPVGVFQEAGEKDWWPGDKPFPHNVTIYGSMESLVSSGCSSALIITDRVFDVDVIEGIESIIYRPKSLAIGLGCHKGVTLKAVEEAITLTLNTAGLTSTSLRVLATIESRKDEQGLLSFSLKHNIPLVIFNRSELSSMIQIPTPSPRVFKHMGIYGVSEPAALLASNNGVILSGKNIFNSVTVAIARDQFAR